MNRQTFGRLNPPAYVWVAALIVFAGSLALLPQGGNDWREYFGPSARNWWPAPWEHGLPNPPWTALILSPLGFLPDRWVTALTNGFSVIVFAVAARKLGAPHWVAFLVLSTPFGIWMFNNGQIEWLVLLGLLLRKGADVPFLVIKPQVGLAVVLTRLSRAGHKWFTYLLPGIVVVILSLLVWRLWPLEIFSRNQSLLDGGWNLSLWPWGIPVGAIVLALGWKYQDDGWGLVASPLLSPFVNGASYLGLVLALASKRPKLSLIGWLAVWIFFIYLGLNV